ncbi:MAG TPA: CoA transferase [Candidatus Polarisedimenticolaceae bacterium]|nr:CoA transferase [Candidatus Polarisedimenticolaceae bacterium]
MTGNSEINSDSALSHLRVIELGDIPASYATRWLADLGADVIKVEPPGGDPSRLLPPFAGNIEDRERSLTFIHANTNKRSIVLHLEADADRETFTRLLASANLLVEATPLGYLEKFGFTDECFAGDFFHLVVVSVTPFGRTGFYRHYKGSDAIANATGGFLFGQGDNTKGQCTAPSHLAYQMAGGIAAMLGLAGIRHARETGAGQRIDVSLQEALTFTNSGSIARYSRENRLERRPGGKAYGAAGTNIYRCKDGRYVHFTTNMPHMWKEFAQNWMTDKSLAGPEWENPRYRDQHAEEVAKAFANFIGQFDADDFANQAQARHLAAAPLNTIGQFVDCEQNRAREWLQDIEHPVIGKYKAPGAPMRLSLTPMRVRRPAPLLDQHRKEILAELEHSFDSRPRSTNDKKIRQPMLSGLRMADLTQQYAGPLGTELLAYYGMEVVKIESAVVASKEREAAVHACMNRAKLGCTINLRSPEGKDLFKQLVEKSDVVVDNFSSGVLERLGFSFETLQQINPGIVQAVMPGWGLTGPLKSWVAWGWQLLAYTGIMRLWGYPDSPMETRCKIAWPDRVGSVTMALGVLAALEYQARTGKGQFIEAGMLEAQGSMMGPAILDYTINRNEWDAMGYREILGEQYAPYGCYPCYGEDNWIIIACAGDEEWRSMVTLIGRSSWAADDRFATDAGRKAHRDELDQKLSQWTRKYTAKQLFRMLQQSGIAAGIPSSGEDLFHDIHLRERGHIVETEAQPWGKITHHGLPGIPSHSAASAARPAPWIGADNDQVFGEILGLSSEKIAELKEKAAIK